MGLKEDKRAAAGAQAQSSPLDFAEINRLYVDLVGLHQLAEPGLQSGEPGLAAGRRADRDSVQLGWIDARLDTYEGLHPGAASINTEQSSRALFGTLAEWRALCAKECELTKAIARAGDLPTVAGPHSRLQRKVMPQVQMQKGWLRQGLAEQMAERAYIRGKEARDLLRQGRGDFGAQRLPISPQAEPFVHSAILSSADRSSLQLFRRRPATSADGPATSAAGEGAPATKFGFGDAAVAAARHAFRKKAHEEVANIDESNGFSIMLRITTAKFLQRLQDVMIATWHDAAAEAAAGLGGLPRHNHQLLPLLCAVPFDTPDLKLQIRMPPTIVIMGSTCTNFIENNELDNPTQKAVMEGTPAVGLEWELRRLAPFSAWGMRHGSFIAKRLFVNGHGEDLSYVSPAGKRSVCLRECVPPHARHQAERLGSFHATAIPHAAEDLMELLKSLDYVKPETVTVLQKFVRCQGRRAQVLRVLRGSSGTIRRFLLTNRADYNDSSSDSTVADVPETRIAIALEFASSARRVEMEELPPVRAGAPASHMAPKKPAPSSVDASEGDGKLLAAQRKSAEAAQEAMEKTWGEASIAVEAIYNVLCARGRGGADTLRAPMLKAEMHAGLTRDASGELIQRTGSLVRSESVQLQPRSSERPGPLVPLKLAADFIKDEDGKLVLLQVKDVVWGPPQEPKR